MKTSMRHGAKYVAPALLLALILILGALAWQQPVVNAESPPRDLPDMGGEPFTAELNGLDTGAEAIAISATVSGWTEILNQDFEGVNWDNGWTNVSQNGTPYKWGTRAYSNTLDPTSQRIAWGVGGGPEGAKLTIGQDGYPNNAYSWLVTGPYDLSDAADATVELDLYMDAVFGDKFAVAASTNGSTFEGQQLVDAGLGNWAALEVSMTAYAGEPKVWLAFVFQSDANGGQGKKPGALIDNVILKAKFTNKVNLPYVAFGASPTPPSVPPTVTPQPGGGDFYQGFGGQIEPWKPVRWRLGTSFLLSHDGGSDDGRSGFLNLLVNTDEAYTIASPLVASRAYPYNIETVVKLRSPRSEQDQYGVIFGANYNGGECPATDFSTCFTQYYEMRVRYYTDNGKERMEMKLKRIDGHDADNNNFGPDLIDWTRVRDVEEDGFVEWDITVSKSGKISISANGNPVGSVTDTTYLDNRYFGVIVRTGPNKDAEAKYDYIKIDWPSNFDQLYP
jgi:hypothetical protein